VGEHSAKWRAYKIIYHNTKARDYIAEMSLNRIMHVLKKKKNQAVGKRRTIFNGIEIYSNHIEK